MSSLCFLQASSTVPLTFHVGLIMDLKARKGEAVFLETRNCRAFARFVKNLILSDIN